MKRLYIFIYIFIYEQAPVCYDAEHEWECLWQGVNYMFPSLSLEPFLSAFHPHGTLAPSRKYDASTLRWIVLLVLWLWLLTLFAVDRPAVDLDFESTSLPYSHCLKHPGLDTTPAHLAILQILSLAKSENTFYQCLRRRTWANPNCSSCSMQMTCCLIYPSWEFALSTSST